MVNQNSLNLAKACLVEKFHPEKIILFGSQARGTANEHSDIDLLVVMPSLLERRRLINEMYESLRPFHLPFELVLLTFQEFEIDRNIPGTIARPASEEGRILYEH